MTEFVVATTTSTSNGPGHDGTCKKMRGCCSGSSARGSLNVAKCEDQACRDMRLSTCASEARLFPDSVSSDRARFQPGWNGGGLTSPVSGSNGGVPDNRQSRWQRRRIDRAFAAALQIARYWLHANRRSCRASCRLRSPPCRPPLGWFGRYRTVAACRGRCAAIDRPWSRRRTCSRWRRWSATPRAPPCCPR